MNFFERQQQARTSSRRLVFLFALAVIGIVLAIDAAVWFALGATELSHEGMSVDDPRIAIIIVVSLLTLAVIGISSLVRIAMLRGGGAEVARSMGATPVWCSEFSTGARGRDQVGTLTWFPNGQGKEAAAAVTTTPMNQWTASARSASAPASS